MGKKNTHVLKGMVIRQSNLKPSRIRWQIQANRVRKGGRLSIPKKSCQNPKGSRRFRWGSH